MQTISILITFIASFVFGILAHRSPKRDWDYIKSWPGYLLLLISTLVYQVEFSQAQAPVIVAGEFIYPEPSLQPFLDWIIGGIVSILLDIPLEIIGIWIGMVSARIFLGKETPK